MYAVLHRRPCVRLCPPPTSQGCPPFAHRGRQKPSPRRSYLPSPELAFDGLGLIFANSSTVSILQAQRIGWIHGVAEQVVDTLGARYERAFRLHFKGGKVRESLTFLSEEGYAPAQAFLGWLYQRGEGVAVDAKEARRLYEGAAASGYSVGECYLGLLDVHVGLPRFRRHSG